MAAGWRLRDRRRQIKVELSGRRALALSYSARTRYHSARVCGERGRGEESGLRGFIEDQRYLLAPGRSKRMMSLGFSLLMYNRDCSFFLDGNLTFLQFPPFGTLLKNDLIILFLFLSFFFTVLVKLRTPLSLGPTYASPEGFFSILILFILFQR